MNLKFIKFGLLYSFRSLFRNRLRTVLILSTVGFTVSISTIAARYAEGVITLWKDGIVDTGTAHAQLHKKGYWEKQEGIDPTLTLVEGNAFEQSIASDPDVEAWVRRVKFEGLIATDEQVSYFVGIAVDPNQEVIVSPRLFYPGFDEGMFVNPSNRVSATIGKGLAQLMKLKLGDEATLIARTATHSENAVDIVIDGILDVPLPGFSKRAVYLHLEHAQRLMRLGSRYSELAFRLKPGVDTYSWIKSQQRAASNVGAELRGWWDIDPFIRKIELIWDTVAGLLCGLLVISAALSIVNMIFMSINERIVEIGTLMAVGAKPKDIRRLFGLEGAVVGILGGILGCIGGNLVVFYMGKTGIPFESPFGSGIETVYPTISGSVIAWSLFVTVAICSLCAIPPARRAASVEPVVAFRGQT